MRRGYQLTATDWPLVKMVPYLKFLDELAFDDAQLENVRWRTSAKLFGISEDELERAKADRLARIGAKA